MRIQRIGRQLESRLGTVREIKKIEKGFSDEEKYMVTTLPGVFLLRVSPEKTCSRKIEEFKIMKKLFEEGVRCNRPIDLFADEDDNKIYSLFSYLPGCDAEDNINGLPEPAQFEIGFQAGLDLKKINSLEAAAGTWKKRKSAKHEYYLKQYRECGYRFENDARVIDFIETNLDRIESGPDRLQHDDFHLGNIVINGDKYSGILDFNRFDWGDPLHEFVKLEWFTWPVSREFARGQIAGYFGKEGAGRKTCLILSVYIAMSIFSTIVWTLKFHPHTMPFIENRVRSILTSYDYFNRIQPEWLALRSD